MSLFLASAANERVFQCILAAMKDGARAHVDSGLSRRYTLHAPHTHAHMPYSQTTNERKWKRELTSNVMKMTEAMTENELPTVLSACAKHEPQTNFRKCFAAQ